MSIIIVIERLPVVGSGCYVARGTGVREAPFALQTYGVQQCCSQDWLVRE